MASIPNDDDCDEISLGLNPNSEDLISHCDVSLQPRDSGYTDLDWSLLDIKTSKRIEEWSGDDVIGLEFDSIEAAEKFYRMYAMARGFGIRRGDKKKMKGEVVFRRWVCNKEGYRLKEHLQRNDRKREPKALTRVGCPASFRVKRNCNNGKYLVKGFVAAHNHELVSIQEVHFLRSHRSISAFDKAQVKLMRGVGVKTSQVMDVMVKQAGGFELVGFSTKDLYNFVDAERRSKIIDTDSESTLAYLIAKAEMDPKLYCKYTVDEEDRLAHLFWTDCRSRLDYSCFGDVLVFDTTYKTNAYKMPFLIFAGANHHGATTIFGCALLPDETIATYVWVLRKFLEAMNGKMPQVVITDGDKSMRKGIKHVLQGVAHRLCSWHLKRNAKSNVKDLNFYKVFKQCLKTIETPQEFEEVWKKMVEDLGLHDHEWVSKMYKKRERWAEAFFVGKFYGGMRSTQRCEGMNSYLKRFLQSRLKLCEFVLQFDRGVQRLRHNEMEDDFKSFNTEPVMRTHLKKFEKHAANIFTRKIFFKVRKQINNENLIQVLSCDKQQPERHVYTLSWYEKPNLTWTVVYYPIDKGIKCTCKLLESVGIPCCHSFSVMMSSNLAAIPSSCIALRWTKEAKLYPQSMPPSAEDPVDVNYMIRSGSLNAYCHSLCYYGSKTSEGYNMVKEEVERLTFKAKEIWEKNTQDTEEFTFVSNAKENSLVSH